MFPPKIFSPRKIIFAKSSETRFPKVSRQSEPSSGGKRLFKIFDFSKKCPPDFHIQSFHIDEVALIIDGPCWSSVLNYRRFIKTFLFWAPALIERLTVHSTHFQFSSIELNWKWVKNQTELEMSKKHVFVRTREAIFGRFGLKKSCFRSNSAGDYRSIWVGKIMFSLEPVQFFTHFQFSSVFYSFPIQFGFLFISNSVQLNWKWTELEMSWIGNECCVILEGYY